MWTALTMGLAVPLGFAAEEYSVKELHYKNVGGYNATCYIRFEHLGKPCSVFKPAPNDHKEPKVVRKGDTIRFNLNKDKLKIRRGSENCLNNDWIRAGTRVWGHVVIDAGERKSCKKDGAVLKFHPDGDTVTYKTGGTTLNNNRCRQWLP